MKKSFLILFLVGLLGSSSFSFAQESNFQKSEEPGSFYSNLFLQVSNFYPNPAVEYIFLDYKIKFNKEVKITVFNILGNPIKTFSLDRNNQSAKFYIGDLNAGTYLYQLSADNATLATKKLIVRN